MNEKPVYVVFVDKKLEKNFEKLNKGRFQDKNLYKFINRAIEDLKQNPAHGIKIPKKIWPKDYIQKYNISNLWKYDLPSSWRVVYTIKEDEITILNVILEWFNHKEYEKRFKY